MTTFDELKSKLIENNVPITELSDGGIKFKHYKIPLKFTEQLNSYLSSNSLIIKSEPLPDTPEGEAVYNTTFYEKKQIDYFIEANYTPLGARVLIRPIEEVEEAKIGSILLADSALVFQKGVILAVGEGERATGSGELMPMSVKVKDIVLFVKDTPYLPIIIGGFHCRLMREGNIECIVG